MTAAHATPHGPRGWKKWLLYVLVAALAFSAALWYRPRPDAPQVAGAAAAPARASHGRIMRLVGTAAVVSGRVLTESGALIPGARVCALDVNYAPIGSPPAPCTSSDATGAYKFEGLPIGAYRIRAATRGHLPGVANHGAPLQLTVGSVHDRVDIVLAGGGARLAGSVVDASGGPIPYATVRAATVQDRAMVDLECDDQGRFEIWMEPGNVALTASAPGYASRMRPSIAPSDDVVLRLAPSGSIEGHVIARDTGAAVAGVRVFALSLGTVPHPGAPSGMSAADGRFDIEGLEHGMYQLWAQSESWRGELEAPLELGVAEQRAGAILFVTKAVQVSGHVVYSGNDAPCIQGSVTLIPQQGDAQVLTSLFAPIAMDGSVVIDGASPGLYLAEVSCDAARLREGPTRIEVADEDVTALIWKVAPGLDMEIHVLDDAGTSLSDVDVLVWFPPNAEGARSSQTFTTDAAGLVRVPPVLAPGNYLVEPGHGPHAPAVSVDLTERTPHARVVIKVPGDASITVRAVDGRGQPVDNLTVIASPVRPPDGQPESASAAAAVISTTAPGLQGLSPRIHALTRSLATGRLAQPLGEGRYRIAPLEAGTYEVRADDGINPSVLATVAGGSPIVVAHRPVEAVVSIDAAGSIRGRVIDEAGPVNDAWVSASAEDGAQPSEAAGYVPAHQRVMTDDDGRFELSGLATRAHYDLRVERPFGALSLRRHVASSDDVTIRLPSLGTLSGAVIDPSTRALHPFTIQVRQLDTGHTLTTLIGDPNGNWKVDRVQPGTLRVSALDGTGRIAEQTLELKEGQNLAGIRLVFPAITVAPTD